MTIMIPILVTLAGIVTAIRFVHPSKAYLPGDDDVNDDSN